MFKGLKIQRISVFPSDRISGSVLFFLALGILWESRGLPMGDLQLPGPAFVPAVLAALLGTTGAFIFIFGANSPRLYSLRWEEAKHTIIVVGASIFATLTLEPLGYPIFATLLLGFLLGAVERQRLRLVLPLALGLFIGSYWLFVSVFRVPLPKGPLGF